MTKKLDRTVDHALDEATASIRELAEEAGYHRTLLAKIREGTRRATPEVARALAKLLRRRGKRLLEIADRLDRLAEAETEQGE